MGKEAETIPVFLVTNTDMVAYTATTMASVLYNTKSNIDFYIMDCGLSDFDKRQLSTLKERFSNMESISFSTVDMAVFEGMNTWYYGMLDAWAMLLFPEAFPEVKKVVHVESDTILVDDIAKLYHENLGKYTIAAAPEIAFSTLSEMFPSPTHVYFNLGMIVINCVQWRKEEVTKKCIDLGKKYGRKFNCLHQDALNMLFQDNYKVLPNRYNLGERKNYVKNVHPDLSEEYFKEEWKHPVLIHFSPNKPWRTQHSFYDEKRIVKYFYEWWYYAAMTPYIEGLRNCFIANKVEDGFKGLKTGIDNYGCSMLDTLSEGHNCKGIMGENIVIGVNKNSNEILKQEVQKSHLNASKTVQYRFLGISLLKIKTNRHGVKHLKLFSFIPVLKIKKKTNSIVYKLFSFIPILKIKEK